MRVPGRPVAGPRNLCSTRGADWGISGDGIATESAGNDVRLNHDPLPFTLLCPSDRGSRAVVGCHRQSSPVNKKLIFGLEGTIARTARAHGGVEGDRGPG